MAHSTVVGGLLGMVNGLREVIGVLRRCGLDREQEKCGCGHQADVQNAVHGAFLVTGQNPTSRERTVGRGAGPGVDGHLGRDGPVSSRRLYISAKIVAISVSAQPRRTSRTYPPTSLTTSWPAIASSHPSSCTKHSHHRSDSREPSEA